MKLSMAKKQGRLVPSTFEDWYWEEKWFALEDFYPFNDTAPLPLLEVVAKFYTIIIEKNVNFYKRCQKLAYHRHLGNRKDIKEYSYKENHLALFYRHSTMLKIETS
jgi:hypothetical protein